MKTTEVNGTMTSEDFERWLALQAAIGFTVKNPEAIEEIRACYRKGGTAEPFRQVDVIRGTNL